MMMKKKKRQMEEALKGAARNWTSEWKCNWKKIK